MTNINDLVLKLSEDAKSSNILRSPGYWGARLTSVLFIYGLAAQFVLGLRPDITTQFTRPLFALEIILLSVLFVTGAIASILAMYPDVYQKPQFLKLPYWILVFLLGIIALQLFMPNDALMVLPSEKVHGMECTVCIASLAIIPSAIIFSLIRKGASVRQFQAGSFAVITASSIGCLTLRLAEANDSMAHLLTWHYIPTVAFAIVGAFIGKLILKW